MSAAIMLRQSSCIHLMVDAASYFQDGVIAALLDKCQAMPEMRCAVTTLGPSRWQPIVFAAIRENFASFDEAKAGIAPLLQRLYEEHATAIREPGMWAAADVWVIGWSDEIDGPDGLTVSMDDPAEWSSRDGTNPYGRRPFVVDPLSSLGLNLHPCPSATQIFEAQFPISLAESDRLVPEIDLLQLLELQRRIPCIHNGRPFIGGYALLTTVNRSGVGQRRIHTWAEDKVGDLIAPQPIDWKRWRIERERDLTKGVVPMRFRKGARPHA
ncbi:hypothetical protein ABIE89_007527 [Bradyrhizobium niftali]|uniref:hypothetical protein n=1 Tax=Bradyrhizobium niftali TaxID=2560055 RepID=UPI00383966FC